MRDSDRVKLATDGWKLMTIQREGNGWVSKKLLRKLSDEELSKAMTHGGSCVVGVNAGRAARELRRRKSKNKMR